METALMIEASKTKLIFNTSSTANEAHKQNGKSAMGQKHVKPTQQNQQR